jgi:hypothetical protein
MKTITLFDRVVNIDLIPENGEALSIITPISGYKPDITVGGALTADIMTRCSVRLANFYAPVDLQADDGGSTYKTIRVEAGYRDGETSKIEGSIWTGTRDTPSPDGYTSFTFYCVYMKKWLESPFVRAYDASSTVAAVAKDLADACGADLSCNVDPSQRFHTALSFNGTIADAVQKIRKSKGLAITPWGNTLSIYDPKIGTGVIHQLNYVTSIKRTAAITTIIAPWVPNIKPGDTIYLDAKYYTSDISGMLFKLAPYMQVLNLEFTFSTVGDTNQMTIVAVNTRD